MGGEQGGVEGGGGGMFSLFRGDVLVAECVTLPRTNQRADEHQRTGRHRTCSCAE